MIYATEVYGDISGDSPLVLALNRRHVYQDHFKDCSACGDYVFHAVALKQMPNCELF